MRVEEIPYERRVELGERADALLKEDLFRGVLAVLAQDAISRLSQAKPGSADATVAHAYLLGVQNIEGHLKALIAEKDRIIKETSKARP